MPSPSPAPSPAPASAAIERLGPAVSSIAPPADTPDGRPGIGLELHGLDPAALTPERAAAVRALVYEHKLVVFRDLDLDDPAYIDLAKRLGEPQIYFQPNYHHPDHPEIFVSSNVPMDGRKVGVAGTGAYWHTDYQFFEEPLPMTLVTPKAIPSGSRGTHYVDMAAALEALPADLAAIARGHRGIHEAKWRYKIQPCDIDKSITQILEEFGAETPTVSHPLVMRHPVIDRECLYASRGFTVGIEGFSIEAGRELLARVFESIEHDTHVHVHPWTKGDILLWDNRQLIHKAVGGAEGEPSVSYRIGVYDGESFCADEPRGRRV